MTYVFARIICLGIEIRQGKISPNNIRDILPEYMESRSTALTTSALNSQQDKIELTPILKLIEKYSEFSLYNLMFEEEDLVNFFDKGIINKDAFEQFIKHKDELDSAKGDTNKNPSWKYIYNYFELSDEEYNTRINILLNDLENHRIIKINDIKHAFSILFSLLRVKVFKSTNKILLSKGKRYVNSVMHKISECKKSERNGEFSYSFSGEKIPEFIELCDYIDKKVESLEKKELPAKAKSLISLIPDNFFDFRGQISIKGSGNQQFVRVPIFNYININDFIIVFESLNPNNQRIIINLLTERYAYREILSDLHLEKSFLISFSKHLKSKCRQKKNTLTSVRYEAYLEEINRFLIRFE
ncbi:hypothetical protein [Armatimonas sp.]|uniref:hypothetical protein n=1 Tax=Armatimonas sp. TaxID=1872638 RepID=UPI00286CFC19|nr:hypothetical protein [Armatimonas sp.]